MRANDGTRSAAEVLIDQLVIHGVRHMFCVPGESYIAALDAFHDRDVAITICRQESGAAIMAEAHGKATGRPGICFVTRGPGATNAAAGLHIARQDSTPLILFVGQISREMREREAFQELDYRAVFGTIAKWATEIDDPARIPELISRAFYTATSGRPGPVVIALPEDMLVERIAVPDAPAFEPVEIWPGLTDMSRLQKMLWAAERPIVLLGGSRWSQGACASVARFAERFALPVATSFRRAHLFDPGHPCYAGDLGIGPNPKLLARVKGADLILLVGGRLGEMPSQAYTLLDIPAPRQTFVHVFPGVESSAGSTGHLWRSMPRRPPLRPRSRACSRRTSCAGATKRRSRMPTFSPGPTSRPSCPARSISAKLSQDCAKNFPPTRWSATAPAISRSGCTAIPAIVATARNLRRSRAPWAMACPPPSG
jgi:acetolactate synthase-1/2/3 large subunit